MDGCAILKSKEEDYGHIKVALFPLMLKSINHERLMLKRKAL